MAEPKRYRETRIMANDVRTLRQRLQASFDQPISEEMADDLRGRLEYVIESSRLKPREHVDQVTFTAPSINDTPKG